MLVYVLKTMHGDILGIYESFQAAEKARAERDSCSVTIFVVQGMENQIKSSSECFLNYEGFSLKEWLTIAHQSRPNDTLRAAWRAGEDPVEYLPKKLIQEVEV